MAPLCSPERSVDIASRATRPSGDGSGGETCSTAVDAIRAHPGDTLCRLREQARAAEDSLPLDLSIAELSNAGLLVETPSRSTRRGADHTARDLAAQLAQGRSCLLLGEPGAGKTVTMYLVARECAERGLLPVVARARDISELEALVGVPSLPAAAEAGVVQLIDGLDEALAHWDGPADIATQYAAALTRTPV